MMNKIDEYKKKINWDVWVDVTSIPLANYRMRPIKKEEKKNNDEY